MRPWLAGIIRLAHGLRAQAGMDVRPQTLDEALDLLEAHTPDDVKRAFAGAPEGDYAARCHFTGGMAMRNDWQLWDKDAPLSRWFQERGVEHGDDKSAIIYRAFWLRLNGREIDMAAEAAYYRDYWERAERMADGGSYRFTVFKDGRVRWEDAP